MNAWFDGETLSRRLFREVNVAIAVDSKHGLYVPVMENVAERDSADIRRGLDRMIADVRPVPCRGKCCGGNHHPHQLWRHRWPLRQPHRHTTQVAIIGAASCSRRWCSSTVSAPGACRLPLSMTF